jgi:hypothetical protein
MDEEKIGMLVGMTMEMDSFIGDLPTRRQRDAARASVMRYMLRECSDNELHEVLTTLRKDLRAI